VSLRVVEDGSRAVAYLAGEDPYADRTRHPLPDLIVLDLNLPLRSGLDVLHWVRSQPQFARTPVVILSSSGRDTDRRTAEMLGADLYRVKPMSGDQFRGILTELGRRWFPGYLKAT
jgi:DNA-binding response OmpR family regulator